jgi:hypothetical protein
VFKKMKANGIEVCKQYISDKWGKDYNCRGHNYIVNPEPMTVPGMFPTGWDYVQNTFKAKSKTVTNQDAPETNNNAPVINNC